MSRSAKYTGPFGDDENFNTNKCSFCGGSGDENSVYAEGCLICSACAEQMDLQDVMDLFGFESVAELLAALAE